jgi:hypothetical protein
MRKVYSLISVLSVFLVGINASHGQSKDFFKDRKFLLNEDGSNYFKMTALNQAWVRYLEYNPGSTIFGVSKENGTDIGIRRFRIQFFGQLTDKVFFYSQIGQNNFNNISDRKQGFFIHDALGEYALDKSKLSVGAGLNGWSGLSRFSSPSVGTILGIDAPLFLQTTNDVTDQFLRKLSVYAKGKLGKLDYRLALAQPMAIQKTANFNPSNVIGQNANFSTDPPNLQWNGYFQYQFKDQETNLTPYTVGTYLGKKSIFNIGAGFIFQKDAMWYKESANGDVVYCDMKHFAVDVFYDFPLGTKGEAISFYGNYTNYDFGKKYLRNLGVMNPSNGSSNPDILNGGGNAFPMYGSGNTLYGQFGYKLKDNLIGNTTLMPYISLQHSDYDRLNAPVNFYDIGVNWLLLNHVSKFTVSYQNRPVFNTSGDLIDHKGAVVAQYQVFLN